MPTLSKLYTMQEASEHNTKDDCWVVIDGKVYDVTSYLDEHPGGDDVVLVATGKDATDDFEDAGHSKSAKELMETFCIGELDTSSPAIRQTDYAQKLMDLTRQYWVVPVAVVSVSVMCSQANSWAKFCLFRIPHYLKEGDDKAYVPQIVSFGPYHHGKRRLRQIDRHKWRALHHVLKRTNHDIYLYLNAVKELKERARACYEGPVISLGSNKFVEMMVLDGFFVIELFRDSRLQLGNPDLKGLVAKLALHFFDPLMPTDEPLTKSDGSKLESSLEYVTTSDHLSDHGGLHCLDVFRRKLKEAGIKFKKRKTDRFWDIKFKNGIFKIPRLLIHDGTKSHFLNLIAYEQCHLDCGNDITSYVVFMDNLINSHQDVGHLHYHGIIEHWLGSDAEVADLFNRLCQELVFDINDSYLSQLSEDVNRYYDHKLNAWCASLRHNYFNNPRAIISLVAAVFLLIVTFTQTFYGVYGYYKPN
uniref:Cytochrome b5 heme-binding domain-containing protein n=1 Tax=Fagus sylvatica TaxID=28930 RepID=A0A2N9FE06_FAGSY